MQISGEKFCYFLKKYTVPPVEKGKFYLRARELSELGALQTSFMEG